MGYAIKHISYIDDLNYNDLDQTKETVRKSLDGTHFIISGENVNEYTKEQIKEILNTNTWTYEFI